MSTALRVGVIGVGYLGRFHARIYSEMSNIDFVGVADINPDAAESVARLYGCAAYSDPFELIPRVDAVSVVVPTTAHREVAEPFLDNGVHMMLEKPVALTLEDAEAIVATAERAGVILQIGHLERFNAGIMALADRVQSPRFLEVHRLSPFVERAVDVDVVTDLMIHDIDIVLSLVNSELQAISAVGSPVVTEHVDIANARLEFTNGAVANVTASRVSDKKFRRIRVFSQDSYQALNFTDQQIDVVRTGKQKPGSKYPEIKYEQIKVQPRQPLDAELEHFIKAVEKQSTPLVDGRDGLKALRVASLVKDKIFSCQS